MMTAWILMYTMATGQAVVYNVYNTADQCLAVAATLKYNVDSGPVECVAVNLSQ
jgi:hypothetical protein